jgi:hypothetical protein
LDKQRNNWPEKILWSDEPVHVALTDEPASATNEEFRRQFDKGSTPQNSTILRTWE